MTEQKPLSAEERQEWKYIFEREARYSPLAGMGLRLLSEVERLEQENKRLRRLLMMEEAPHAG